MSRSVWRGALLLTVVAVLVRIMGAAYRIPYQNIAGDLGFYVYQQVYPFFAIAVFLATYGFPAAISKMVASQRTNDSETASVLYRSFCMLSAFAVASFVILYAGAPWISKIMGDAKLFEPLRAVAFTFLFIPPVAAVRGFFQGYERMRPTAVSQLLEQFFRAGTILVLTGIVVTGGFGPYAAGTAAAYGSVTGMVVAAIVLLAFAVYHRGLFRHTEKVPFRPLMKKLSCDGLAFSVSSLLLVLFLLIDALTVVSLLQAFGTSPAEAKLLMGVYDRGYPLVQLATVAAMSFSLAFLPAVARARAGGREASVRRKSGLAMKIALAFGLGSAVGFALVTKPVNIMLFENDAGSSMLAWLGATMLFSTVAMTAAGMLQAVGKERLALRYSCIGLVLKLGLNVCLVPWLGTFGAATATVFSFACLAVLNGWAIHRQTGAFTFLFLSGRKVFAALLLMVAAVCVWRTGLAAMFPAWDGRLYRTIEALGGTAAGAAVYGISLLRLRFFSTMELKSISKTEKSRRTA